MHNFRRRIATDRGHGKVSQLELARRIGLEVPRSLATNDPEAAREFLATCPQGAIYKPFRSPTRSVELDDGTKQWCIVFTTKLDEQAVAKLDGVRHAPCIFQEYVPKKLELRIEVPEIHTPGVIVVAVTDPRRSGKGCYCKTCSGGTRCWAREAVT